jgi:nucleotide-binding universal stress UspA family protein
MAGFETLLAPLGCTSADSSLIAYTALLARLGASREVRFVHVLNSGRPAAPAAALRDQLRERVAAHFDAPARTECDVLQGPITDRVLDYASELEADLIVVGSQRRLLGARLAMVAPCSVAVVPEQAPARLQHMAVAIDFSEDAGDTLEWATALAAGASGIRCTALHVMTHESADMFAEDETEPEQAEAMRRIVARADRHGVPVEPRLAGVRSAGSIGRRRRFFLPASIEGADVAATILAEAAEIGADCLALGTRGRSASASILLGSVTEKVIERAAMPLLVGKRAGAHLGLTQILLGRTGKRSASVKTN